MKRLRYTLCAYSIDLVRIRSIVPSLPSIGDLSFLVPSQMCCIISGDPLKDESGRYFTAYGDNRVKFQTDMMHAPCVDCPSSCLWFSGQCVPLTSGITQYFLRKKVLKGDMSKYACFQGYYTICCCIKAGTFGEESCPDFCAFMEGCFCNCVAISASRQYVMEEYNLESDECDYRLIRINNCIQWLSCICSILAIIDDSFRSLAEIVNRIADIIYHTTSGCMTAQVAYEVNYQTKMKPVTAAVVEEIHSPMADPAVKHY